MKENKIIDKAMISFNIANGDPNEASYAILGGLDEKYKLTPFDNQSKDKWSVAIDHISLKNQTFKKSYNAIIDTGSSLYSLPEDYFNFVVKNLN